MIDPEYKESPEYLRECIAQLQSDRDALLTALKNVKGYFDRMPVRTAESGTYVKGPYGEKLSGVVFCGQEDVKILGVVNAAISRVESH